MKYKSCHFRISDWKKKFFLFKDIKKGITDPLDPITFPYLTIEKTVLSVFFLAAMKSLSEANFSSI